MSHYKKIFSVFIIILIACKINAQSLLQNKIKDSTTIGQLFVYDTKQTFLGLKHAFSRPFHWKKKDYTKLGTIIVGSLALSTIDDEFNEFSLKQKPPKLFQEIGTRFGSPQVYFIANAGLYGYGLFTKNESIRKTSVLIISASITTGLIQSLSKTVFGRARPGNIYKSTDFRFWSNDPTFHSFPSGHTVLSITMAHSIAKQFDNTWSKISIYTLGAIAPISRLFTGAHWLTDIAIGTVLSIAVVDSIDKFLFKSEAYHYRQKKKRLSWTIRFTGNQIGLVGTF